MATIRSIATILATCLTLALAGPGLAGPQGRDSHPAYVPGELIVRFQPDVTPAELEDFYDYYYRNYDVTLKEDLDGNDSDDDPEEKLLTVPAGKMTELIKIMGKDPRVRFVEPNYLFRPSLLPADPRFDELWGLHNIGQSVGGVVGTADADIDAPEAWDVTTGSAAVIVGVIDTGVDYTHEDLAANMWVNPGEIPGNGIDDDGNGHVDDIHGINAILNIGDPFDDHGHGTHVSGTIGAVDNNGLGVVGVNWNVRIAACKFLPATGSGTAADAIKCFKYFNHLKHVLGQNVVITNNSWGGGGFSQALKEAMAGLEQPGMVPILHVAAAGNNFSDIDQTPSYPASFDLDNIIAVAAANNKDQYAAFSNHGAASVDLAAPGVDVLSTVPIGACGLCDPSGYGFLNGTSMASPHVAGAAALLWAKDATFALNEVKLRLLFSSDPLTDLTKNTVTNGRLNVFAAMEDGDITAPAAVTDAAVFMGLASAVLTWIATGDDGLTGRAGGYDVRYSTSPITEATWDTATRAVGEPRPQPSGASESFTVANLPVDTPFFFALKVIDNVGNASPLSNVVQGSTIAGTILFADDMEGGIAGWTISDPTNTALWHQSGQRSNSPVTAWHYGNEGQFNYDTGGRNSGVLLSQVIDLPPDHEVVLIFSEWSQVEADDQALVQIRDPFGIWPIVFRSQGNNNVWRTRQVDLSGELTGLLGSTIVVGQSVRLGFLFDANAINNNLEGWYIDDVQVRIAPTGPATITSAPVTEGVVAQPYTYQAEASGVQPITWSLVTGPAGMTIEANTGLVSWTPTVLGSFGVQMQAANALGSDTQIFTIIVTDVPPGPEASLSISAPASVTEGDQFTLSVTVTNTGGVTATGVSVNLAWAPDLLRAKQPGETTQSVGNIPPGGSKTATWTMKADSAGTTTVTATATDALGELQNVQATHAIQIAD